MKINALLCCTFSSFLLIAGCSFLEPVKTPEITQYVLSDLPKPYAAHSAHPITLLVSTPTTNPIYDTTEIFYSDQPFQSNTYAVSRWAKKPGQMIQPLLVSALLQSRFFHAVIEPPYCADYDYSINTQIVCLKQVFEHTRGQVKFITRVQVVSNKTNSVIAEKTFNITEPMRYCTVQSGVYTTNRAVEKFLHQLTIFTIQSITLNEEKK